jgi:hypothetical protein
VSVSFSEFDAPFQIEKIKAPPVLNKFLLGLVNKLLFRLGPAQLECLFGRLTAGRLRAGTDIHRREVGQRSTQIIADGCLKSIWGSSLGILTTKVPIYNAF